MAAILMAGSLGAGGAELSLTVVAGPVERIDTPVSAEIELPRQALALRPSLVAGETTTPAQFELLEDGRVRLWWQVSRLAAGAERTYRLRLAPPQASEPDAVFAWTDSSGPHGTSSDLRFQGRDVLRYLYSPFDPNDVEATKKVFHHVFSPASGRLITKGAGGLYSHHRGIFFGYNRCQVGEETYDVWHARDGEHQGHREKLKEIAGPVVGGHRVRVHWNDRQGRAFIKEERQVLAFRQDGGRSLLLELTSTLTPTHSPVHLGGDRQHSGVQFRAAQAVAENRTQSRYLRPEAWKEPPPNQELNTEDYRDLPWNALQFKLGDEAITVAYLSDPGNPDNAAFSERLYGRFGEFFPWDLRHDNPLKVRYRWWIVPSHDVSRRQIQQRYEALAQPPVVRIEP